MNIDCYAAQEAKAPLEKFNYPSRNLGPWDVEVKISHCGICHSDTHLVDNDWGISQYPLVPGHEIVGTISAMGSSVKHLKAGQRVGIGWQCSSCMNCEWCISGKENLCGQVVNIREFAQNFGSGQLFNQPGLVLLDGIRCLGSGLIEDDSSHRNTVLLQCVQSHQRMVESPQLITRYHYCRQDQVAHQIHHSGVAGDGNPHTADALYQHPVVFFR